MIAYSIEAVSRLFAFVAFLIWLGAVFHLHRTLADYAAGSYPIGAGKAAGFHLIPLYSFYLAFRWTGTLAEFLTDNSSSAPPARWLPGTLIVVGSVASKWDAALVSALLFISLLWLMRSVRRTLASPDPENPASVAR